MSTPSAGSAPTSGGTPPSWCPGRTRPGLGVGGHIATYASAASLYEVGFNHFFRGKDHGESGDQVFIQGHAAPGIYARAFLEGRLSEQQLNGFRQELSAPGGGLPSYPHPRLMPDFWEFPTVSMGLGAIDAVYQARFNKYLLARQIKDTSRSRVWAFLGDGETDEPEVLGSIGLAAREELDNLTFVINCNLQRLDGPVRGNGKIIQELEAFFRGAGWNVIKVIWGRDWDPLLAKDVDGVLVNKMNTTPDGQFQTYAVESGAYTREHFFGGDPRLRAMVAHLSDDEIRNLSRGGHDYRKVYAAFKAATEHVGQPTVILAHTIKGWTLGPDFEARNATHQMKKLTVAELKEFRDRLYLEIPDSALEAELPPYYHPGENSDEIAYMKERRQALGGYLPKRVVRSQAADAAGRRQLRRAARGSGKQPVATTMAFVRLLKDLMKDPEIGARFVPIIPDEARTFGMDSLFPTARIYSPHGQTYEAVDRALLLSYKESERGQILHEGISEAGAMASTIAAGTAYATHGTPDDPDLHLLLDVRVPADRRPDVGDRRPARPRVPARRDGRPDDADRRGPAAQRRALAAARLDQPGLRLLRRGLGLRAGRDRQGRAAPDVRRHAGASARRGHLLLPDRLQRALRPARRSRLTTRAGLRHSSRPSCAACTATPLDRRPAAQAAATRRTATARGPGSLASGVAVRWALEAQRLLAPDWGVHAEVWSATSWTELRRDGLSCEEWNLLHPDEAARVPYVTAAVRRRAALPVVAVSDWIKAVPDQIARWVPAPFTSLGTDGWGFSDTRPAARRFFHVDGESITLAVLGSAGQAGRAQARGAHRGDHQVPARPGRQPGTGLRSSGLTGRYGLASMPCVLPFWLV